MWRQTLYCLRAPQNGFFFSEWSSRQASITSMNDSLNPTRYVWISASSELYVSIVRRAFGILQPITVLLINFNLTLSQSESYINHVLTSSTYGWSVKGTPFLGLQKKNSKHYFERYPRPDLSSPNGVVKRRNLDHMGVFILMPSCGKILCDICESKTSTEKLWRRNQIQCIFIGRNIIICRFAWRIYLFVFICWVHSLLESDKM